MAPALSWSHPDDEILFELEYDEKGRIKLTPDGRSWQFTDRAEKAQVAKRQRLFQLYHPRKSLPRKYQASPENPYPPRLLYGWAYTTGFLETYVKCHRVEAELWGSIRKDLQKDVVVYGALSEDEKNNETLQDYMKGILRFAVKRHLHSISGIQLSMGYPFADEAVYTGMFVLYSNHDVDERYDEIEATTDVEEGARKIQEAITACGHTSVPELLWWYDRRELYVGLNTPGI